MNHSSAFVAAVADDDDDDDGGGGGGGYYCLFCFFLLGLQNQFIIRNWKRYCQLYQKHGSMKLWSKNVGISRFSQGLCGNEINQDVSLIIDQDMIGCSLSYNVISRRKFKKGGQLQLARKNDKSDPFVVYGHYEILEKEMQCLGIKNKREWVYKCEIPQNASTMGQ